MRKGRAPCCDKSKVKRGPWSPAEDLMLTNFVQTHGHPNWRALPTHAGLLRCGKSCRLRWVNYLSPDVKRGNFTHEEEQRIINLHDSFGNKWSRIASCLPGRTDNEIKNVWNTHLKKRVTKKVKKNCEKTEADDAKNDYLGSSSSTSSSLTSDKEVQESGINTLDENNVKSTRTSDEESNETANYNSPITYCASNFSNSSEDQTCSSLKKDNEKIEIPLNSDINIWELMDSVDPLQSSVTELNDGNKDFNCNNSSDKFDGDFECGKWLRFFENELGLTGNENDYLSEQGNMVQTTMQYEEMYLEPEFGPALDYFPIWNGLL